MLKLQSRENAKHRKHKLLTKKNKLIYYMINKLLKKVINSKMWRGPDLLKTNSFALSDFFLLKVCPML